MTDELELFVVDAFEEGPFTGNPAAVVLLKAPLAEVLLPKIARQMNLSETAFVLGEGERRSLRWFTPEVEVDLCGHATLGSAHVLFRDPDMSRVEFETRSGVLVATRAASGIEIDLPADPPSIRPVPDELLAALGVSEVEETLSGKTDVVIVVPTERTVRELQPDLGAVARHGGRGVIVTSVADESEGTDFVSRFFGPAVGVPEDPVTGSAHTLLAPYWTNRLERGDELVARQLSSRGGRIECRILRDTEGSPERVALRGSTRTVIEGRLRPSG